VFVAGAAVLASTATGTAAFAAGSTDGFAFAAGASGLLDRTDTLPVRAGIESNRADNINKTAAAMVTFDKTVAVPRGLKAELETLLVNNAPASVLPGCRSTAAIRTMHERKNIK